MWYDLPHIEVRREENALGFYETVEYIWPENASVAMLSLRVIGRNVKPGDVITVGMMRLRVLDRDPSILAVPVMREGLLAFAYQYRHALFLALERTYHRLIATAAIWGLAAWDLNRIPTWRDFYLVQRILKCVKR